LQLNSNYGQYSASSGGNIGSGGSPYQGYLQPVSHASLAPLPAGPQPQVQETRKVRNRCNVRKPTLVLTPCPHDREAYRIEFEFDAIEPCYVSTFVLTLEAQDGSLNYSMGGHEPGPRVRFPSGMGQRFSHREHVVRPGRTDLETLRSADGDLFPIIIRLEAVTEEGQSQGQSIDHLPPGSAPPLWVQSQTTYAVVEGGSDGLRPRVLKQKIFSGGATYELQEIFGINNSVASGLAAGGQGGQGQFQDDGSADCIICMSKGRDTAVLPCRHMCMCQECAKALISPDNTSSTRAKCPICRRLVHNILTIVKKDGGGGGGGRGHENNV